MGTPCHETMGRPGTGAAGGAHVATPAWQGSGGLRRRRTCLSRDPVAPQPASTPQKCSPNTGSHREWSRHCGGPHRGPARGASHGAAARRRPLWGAGERGSQGVGARCGSGGKRLRAVRMRPAHLAFSAHGDDDAQDVTTAREGDRRAWRGWGGTPLSPSPCPCVPQGSVKHMWGLWDPQPPETPPWRHSAPCGVAGPLATTRLWACASPRALQPACRGPAPHRG